MAQAAFAAATGKTSKTTGSARSAKSNSLAQVQGLQKLGKYLTTTLVGARENSPRSEKQQGRGRDKAARRDEDANREVEFPQG